MLICNTNNGTERLNEDLKYDELVGWKNCTLSELLTIVIESFLPKLYEKYIELNVEFISGYRKYQYRNHFIIARVRKDEQGN